MVAFIEEAKAIKKLAGEQGLTLKEVLFGIAMSYRYDLELRAAMDQEKKVLEETDFFNDEWDELPF